MLFVITLLLTVGLYAVAMIWRMARRGIGVGATRESPLLKVWKRMAGIAALLWTLFLLTFFFQLGPLFEDIGMRIGRNLGRNYLRDVLKAERAYFGNTGTYTDNFETLGWMPPDGPPLDYTLYFSASENPPRGAVMEKRQGAEPTGVTTKLDWWQFIVFYNDERKAARRKMLSDVESRYGVGATPDSFTCVAVGNLDNDNSLEAWAINDRGDLIQISDDIKGRGDSLNLFVASLSNQEIVVNFYPLGIVVFLINVGFWIILKLRTRNTTKG